MSKEFVHIPVFHSSVLDLLAIQPGERVLDVTLGLGGHSASFLEANAPDGTLVALDADAANLQKAIRRLHPFEGRFTALHANFRELPGCLPDPSMQFHIVFADLGLSSPHIDDVQRGFSFRSDAPLDMRFDSSSGTTASDLLMELPERDLLMMFREYGELSGAKRLVHAILRERGMRSIATSQDLNSIIENTFGYKTPSLLPQIYQALRIAVNDELGALQHLLQVLPSLLAPGARAAILSYHSLEDRLVKQAFKSLCTPQHDPVTGQISVPAHCSLLTKRPILCSEQEAKENPRARSAILRGIRKLSS